MSIQKELKELLKAQVISEETAASIQSYYKSKGANVQSRLFAIFGVLGATLIGLGIILIIAHNWDNLSRGIKTFFAFIPLLISQVLCVYALYKKRDSTAWIEGGSSLLFFSIGASIAMVGQIYNLPGNTPSFILTWMLLSLPIIYLMPSSFVGLFYVIGSTYYGSETGYGYYSRELESFLYWPLFLAVVPHYLFLLKNKAASNFLTFFNWVLPLSLTICLGIIAEKDEELLYLSYFLLFNVFYFIGKLPLLNKLHPARNGFLVFGSLGMLFLLLTASFKWFWEDLFDSFTYASIEMLSIVLLFSINLALFVYSKISKESKEVAPFEFLFFLFTPLFLLGYQTIIPVYFTNLLLFIIGIILLIKGVKREHFGILNFGLLIITAVITSRFFDTNISFVIRGLLFIFIGLGFFLANYWMLKKRKND